MGEGCEAGGRLGLGGATAGRGSSQVTLLVESPGVRVAWDRRTGREAPAHETLWAMVRRAQWKKDGDSRGTLGPWMLIKG